MFDFWLLLCDPESRLHKSLKLAGSGEVCLNDLPLDAGVQFGEKKKQTNPEKKTPGMLRQTVRPEVTQCCVAGLAVSDFRSCLLCAE